MEETLDQDDTSLTCHLHYHEYDFKLKSPTLILQGDFGSAGYNVNKITGFLTRICICYARNSVECACGYFDYIGEE